MYRVNKEGLSTAHQLTERQERLRREFAIQSYTKCLSIYNEELTNISFHTLLLEPVQDLQDFFKNIHQLKKDSSAMDNAWRNLEKLGNSYNEIISKLYLQLDKLVTMERPTQIEELKSKISELVIEMQIYWDKTDTVYSHFVKYRDIYNKLSQIKRQSIELNKIILEQMESINPNHSEEKNKSLQEDKRNLNLSLLQKEIHIGFNNIKQFEHIPCIKELFSKIPEMVSPELFFQKQEKFIGPIRTALNVLLQNRNIYNNISCKTPDTALTDEIHRVLILLAKLCPNNAEDYITLSEINKCDQLVISTGNQYDINALIAHHHHRFLRNYDSSSDKTEKYLLDPVSNKAFYHMDLIYILSEAQQKDLHLSDVCIKLSLKKLAKSGPQTAFRILNTPLLMQKLLAKYDYSKSLLLREVALSHPKTAEFILVTPEYYKPIFEKSRPEEINLLVEYYGKIDQDHAKLILDTKRYQSNLFSPLHFAIKCGFIELIKAYLNKETINKDEPYYGTPLYVAAQMGDIELVKFLIDQGAEIDTASSLGTPLFAAAKYGHLSVVQLLLSHQANSNAVESSTGLTPLLVSIQSKHKQITDYFLEQDTLKNTTHVMNTKYLEIMLEAGYSDFVKFQLKKEGNLDVVLTKLLQVPSSQGCIDVMEYILAKGGRVKLNMGADLERSIKYAAKNGHLKVLKGLLLLSNYSDDTIKNHLESTNKSYYSDEVVSVLQATRLFKMVFQEINKILFDDARLNYPKLLAKCFEHDPDFTFDLYTNALDKKDFDSLRLTRAMLKAASANEAMCNKIIQVNLQKQIPIEDLVKGWQGNRLFQEKAILPVSFSALEELPAVYNTI